MAEHNPGELSGKNKRLAALPHSTLHEFAATKEKGLPARVPMANLMRSTRSRKK